MVNELLLLTGSDIPFPQASVTIHQPTIKEIGYIGEDMFFTGCGFLDFSKDLLDPKDKSLLDKYDDFDIFMSLMLKKDNTVKRFTEAALSVLFLMFPLYQVTIEVRNNTPVIILKKDAEERIINKQNFTIFKQILKEMFDLNFGQDSSKKYNPSGDMAKKIAEKFQKREKQLQKLTKEKSSNKNITILSRYISILAIGLQKDLNKLSQYTVYQLFNEFQRFQLKTQWDAYIQARMAGAKDLDEVDNWMIDLKDQDQKKKNKTKK